ncbi:ABC-type transport system, periplasmic component [Desulfarculus baarsii DSM 2075]|uniref:ABC-type transport system, periplasmic component n=1 Tax=Desulfarculus baarsii (strain ATCC 33931 / DSM 2075 / LMG 7858 / VKM B-1802 / 2st14) TaxID=644282 RepID=E1QFV7_DESB2|nr:hypothetical protein [Desulfarculus baarsii]ADK84567.1 ABC-type transport system, periplasmic component [Desulfarculus baarsii DSM 2075]
MRRAVFSVIVILAVGGLGAFYLFSDRAASPTAEQGPDAPPRLVFYTSFGATTPQIPFWGAVKAGWPGGAGLETRLWKDLDDLRGVIMAGRGDIWLGHSEGLAQAALRGAPVCFLAVTGWRKFYFLSADPAAVDLASLATLSQAQNSPLMVTPPDSPAMAILDDVAARGGPRFVTAPHAPRQLALLALRGQARHILAPEPLVSLLLTKAPGLRVVASLEDEHAKLTGGPARLPIAGLAMHGELARRRPELARQLLAAMERVAADLADDPAAGLALLPPEVAGELGPDVLRLSLSRDMIMTRPTAQVRQEVLAYLRLVMSPADRQRLDQLPEGFWGPPAP